MNIMEHFDFDSEDLNEFTIMNIYTNEGRLTIAIDNKGIEILDSERYDDN